MLHYINGSGLLSDELARTLFTGLLDGNRFCHVLGIHHRDLKLENLMLTSRDEKLMQLKIADFGLSDLQTLPSNLSATFCGSPLYAAPELMTAGAAPDGYDASKSDVWSCGVILYALLASALPFDAEDICALVRLIQIGVPNSPVPSTRGPAAAELVAWMLTVEPKQRPSASEVLSHAWASPDVANGKIKSSVTTLSLASVPRDPNASDDSLPAVDVGASGTTAGGGAQLAGGCCSRGGSVAAPGAPPATVMSSAAAEKSKRAAMTGLAARRPVSLTTRFFKDMMLAEKSGFGDLLGAAGAAAGVPAPVKEEEELLSMAPVARAALVAPAAPAAPAAPVAPVAPVAPAAPAAPSSVDVSDGGASVSMPARPQSELGESSGSSRPNPTPPLANLPQPVPEKPSSQDSSAERRKGKVLTRGELDAVKAEAAEIEVREREAEREAALSALSSPRSANISPRSVEPRPCRCRRSLLRRRSAWSRPAAARWVGE